MLIRYGAHYVSFLAEPGPQGLNPSGSFVPPTWQRNTKHILKSPLPLTGAASATQQIIQSAPSSLNVLIVVLHCIECQNPKETIKILLVI